MVAVTETRRLSHLLSIIVTRNKGAFISVSVSWTRPCNVTLFMHIYFHCAHGKTSVTVVYFISQLGIFSHDNILSEGHISYSQDQPTPPPSPPNRRPLVPKMKSKY